MIPNPGRLVVLCLASLWFAGCAYQSTAQVSPAYNVYSSYDEKVPGKYALFVDGNSLSGKFKVDGFACSAHSYPMNAAAAFRISALRTFENLVEEVKSVGRPLDAKGLARGKFKGQIRVEAEDMDVRLRVIPGFWTQSMEADVEMVAHLVVDGKDGRLLGTTVSSDADSTAEAGGACGGGAQAISDAASRSMKELMGRIGERFSNSQRVRGL